MSLINEVLNQQLRHLLRAKRRSDDRRTIYADGKRSHNRWRYHCNRRYPGGQDPRAVSSRRISGSSRQASLPVGNRCIVPLLHIWLRLNDVTPVSSSVTRQRCLHRLRLRERTLLENVRQVIHIHWNNFRLRWLPATSVTATEPQGTVSPTETTSTRNRRHLWLRNLSESFHLISKRLETALTSVGSSPHYVNTSAAMEVLDLDDLIEQVNSALVDHLLNNSVYILTPNASSLTALGLF